ncbi:MAG: biotin--[acetyl-CoA-carboxylase] ligase [Phycisphaerales bacterium]|nr:biotin--[acetyl-CoA-carboxylase] ligase [Phycisphaerales bacterium]
MTAPIEAWPDRLEAVAATTRRFDRVCVVRETGSALDAARRFDAGPGTIVSAWRQTAGRGRLGRAWADTAGHGVAIVLVVAPTAPERLAIATAVGVAEALDRQAPGTVGIKWPNDLVVDERKIGGILVEQDAARALVGIGINVGQETWPEDLAARAVSLRQVGVCVDRLDVQADVIRAVDAALDRPLADLAAAFDDRNVLRDRDVTIGAGGRTVTGRLVRWCPTEGLIVRTSEGTVAMPAATSTVVG